MKNNKTQKATKTLRILCAIVLTCLIYAFGDIVFNHERFNRLEIVILLMIDIILMSAFIRPVLTGEYSYILKLMGKPYYPKNK
ncbi:hypothetical protein GCM10011365_20100 [Marinicella pacifica]|uniref:Uncharacterized protein n=1 Tax=Marinicella pacifica TaxID=1171543 RepID=A0A917CW53_9GAMM|nr:hypothetical protein [Marinicella pacifica]GGF98805.1 hypothetical protein GCM10011365_20100 [Marinicella pacifica]